MTPHDRAAALAARLGDGPTITVDRNALVQMVASEIQAESNAQLMRNRAHDRQADVAAFHRKFGVPCPERPGWPAHDRIDLRVKLIAEEFCEFLRDAGYEGNLWISRWNAEAEVTVEIFDWHYDADTSDTIGDRDFAKAADALIDMEYVILGTHCEFGIDSNPLWAEVQRANVSKQGGKRGDGKILKGDGWVPPDIAACLKAQGWRAQTDIIDAEFEMLPTERGDKGFGSTGR